MGIPLHQQWVACLYALLTGVICGILYDLVRVSRVLFGLSRYTECGRKLYVLTLPLIGSEKRKNKPSTRPWGRLVALAIGDIVFAVSAGCAFSIFLYQAASGCFRWFYLFLCFVGFCLYYFTVGKVMMISSEAIAFLLKTVLRYALWLVAAPFRLLLDCTRRICRRIRRNIFAPLYRACSYRRRIRYTRRVRDSLPITVRVIEGDFPGV